MLRGHYFVVQSIGMNEQERAEEHLKTIRRLMERATIYRAISAPTALVGGLLSLVGNGIYEHLVSDRTVAGKISMDPFLMYPFLEIWLVVLLLTAGANTMFIALGARKRKEPMFSASMKAALIALAPAFIAGAAFSLLCVSQHADMEYYGTIGTEWVSIEWAIFYGLGLLATSHFAPRSLTLLGWAFLLSGIAGMIGLRFGPDPSGMVLVGGSLFGPDYSGPVEMFIGSSFMAGTFGLYHLIYAVCVWPRKRAAAEA